MDLSREVRFTGVHYRVWLSLLRGHCDINYFGQQSLYVRAGSWELPNGYFDELRYRQSVIVQSFSTSPAKSSVYTLTTYYHINGMIVDLYYKESNALQTP